MDNDQTPEVITLEDECIAVFIPFGDDTFACVSHECLAVVNTPSGVWLFSKRTEDD